MEMWQEHLEVFVVSHEVVAVWACAEPSITKAITTLRPLLLVHLGQKSLPKPKTFFWVKSQSSKISSLTSPLP